MMANTSAIWQQAAHTNNQMSSPSCPTGAKQKTDFLMKNVGEFFRKKVTEKCQDGKSKRTRLNGMRFQTDGGHWTPPASLHMLNGKVVSSFWYIICLHLWCAESLYM